ncbi:MAG: helix-turn-helix transcriptional regulator [Roseovarius sp.]
MALIRKVFTIGVIHACEADRRKQTLFIAERMRKEGEALEHPDNGGLATPTPLVLPLIMGEWLSASRHARIICDDQQRVLWGNANLRQVLKKDIGLKLEREQLILIDRKPQAALAHFIQSPQLDHTAIRLGTSEAVGNHIMQCRRLRVEPYGDAFGLRVLCDDSSHEADFIGLEEYFGLTRQEAYTCRQILNGRTVQDIADKSDKAADTIRFHIRNIYQKLNVSSREALFAKLRFFIFD